MSEKEPGSQENSPETEAGKEGFPIICAWCQKKMSESSVEGSHGICEDCLKKELDALNKGT